MSIPPQNCKAPLLKSFWQRFWLDLGADVEQSFNCLIVQNRQAVRSMRRSMMDWTLEDNIVDGLFFCATLTGRRGGHIPFVQAGAETSDTGAEAVKLDLGSSWEGHSGGCRCRGWKCGVLWGCPPSARHIYCCYQMNWWVVVRRVQMGVSIWGALNLHSMDRWVLSGADVQASWHGVLKTMWLHCDEAQQVGCLRGLEGCPQV